MSLSDLELVAQAMAPIDRPAAEGEERLTDQNRDRTSGSVVPGKPANGSGVQHASASDAADNLQNAPSHTAHTTSIDPSLLANLSQSDLASIQPILNALSNMNGLENLDDLDEDDPQFQEIMRQLEAADGVADVLDEKLDGLIGQLREEESKMEREKEVEQGKTTAKSSQEK